VTSHSPRAWTPSALAAWIGVSLLGAIALAIRLNNALRYPADWGFDATFNWRYIYRLTQSWQLPDPAAGWATGDPPLYFYASALVMRLAETVATRDAATWWIPLMGTAAGLGVVALAARLVALEDPGNRRRVLLAAALLLFLPAHIQMSAMVNEEIVASLLISIALFLLARGASNENRLGSLRGAALIGGVGGLAILTKLSGALVLATGAATFCLDGLRGASLGRALRRTAVLLVAGAVAGGWFYLRNRVEYGYFQPHGLPAHQMMYDIPPGERSIVDYLRIPVATFSDPQLLHPDLLHSVWGSTYATVWFDGHRFFLPRDGGGVRALGSASLVLALLPTLAFGVGLVGGARRALRAPGGADTPLLLLTVAIVAGFVFFTWKNPWFVVVKGTSLLGLSLPFAYYTSEVLDRWTRRRPLALATWFTLAALALCTTASSSFNVVFDKTEVSGLPWQETESPR
jgi:hypothetical protein